ITEIRKVLGETPKTPRLITTVHRRGYRFLAAVTQAAASEVAGAIPPCPPPPATIRTPLAIQNTPPLVERESALHHLHMRLAGARQGSRQVVFVTGEAGIGKTAVVEAFLAQAAADPRLWIAHGQCIEHYGPGEAYLPMWEALGRLCRGPEGRSVVELLRQQAPTWLIQMPWLLNTADRE